MDEVMGWMEISLGPTVSHFHKLWDQNCNKTSYGTKLRPLPKLWDQNCNNKSYGTKLKPLPKLWDQKCTLAKKIRLKCTFGSIIFFVAILVL